MDSFSQGFEGNMQFVIPQKGVVISIVTLTGTAPKESVQKFTNSTIKIGIKKIVWNIPIKSLVYGRSLSPDIYKKYYTHMLKMAPFLTHIFMESWPCFFEIRVPTNGNICQSHFSNVNEMDGAAIHSEQKHFIWKNKMYSKNFKCYLNKISPQM